jgi:hypothetical protein
MSVIPATNTIAVKMPALRFVTERLMDREKTVRQVNPFCIWKTLTIADKVKNASQLNCMFLVEMYSKKQLETILKIELLGSCCLLFPVGSLSFHLCLMSSL